MMRVVMSARSIRLPRRSNCHWASCIMFCERKPSNRCTRRVMPSRAVPRLPRERFGRSAERANRCKSLTYSKVGPGMDSRTVRAFSRAAEMALVMAEGWRASQVRKRHTLRSLASL